MLKKNLFIVMLSLSFFAKAEEYCIKKEAVFKTSSRIRHIYSYNYKDFSLEMIGVNFFKIILNTKDDVSVRINDEEDFVIYYNEYCDEEIQLIDI